MATVRRANLADAEGIATVHVASWRAAYAGLLPQQMLDALSVGVRTEQWQGQIADPNVTTLVAVDDGVVVGFAAVGRSRDEDADDETGELYAIYVHPSVWGDAVGRAVHDAALAALAERFVSATLWVLSSNVRARAFYERQGWREDGAVKADRRGNVVLDELRYRVQSQRDVVES